MRKNWILLFSLLLCVCTITAQTARKEIEGNILKSASNYYAYPSGQLPVLTPAPKGYQPFYIDHYGRHGSRWLIDRSQYSFPMEQLAKADKYGKLTDKGKMVFAELCKINASSENRLGELTDVGADQHKGIAARMYKNFPQVFSGSASVDARSTIVIRCILSMENECQQLIALNPKLKITHDASHADMYYLNYNDTTLRYVRHEAGKAFEQFEKAHVHPQRILNELISDEAFGRDSIDGMRFISDLFDVASNQQSHYTNVSFYDLFNNDELYDLWQTENVYWYINYGPSPATKGRVPYSQSNLLKNMIASADKAISNGRNCATLRFGHEVCVMPLACLMELDNCGKSVDNLDELADQWQNYKIFPMGCNIQMIFYKKAGSKDVLVKVLLNERETSLPVKTDMKPYYHWNDVKAYYEKKLTSFN